MSKQFNYGLRAISVSRSNGETPRGSPSCFVHLLSLLREQSRSLCRLNKDGDVINKVFAAVSSNLALCHYHDFLHERARITSNGIMPDFENGSIEEARVSKDLLSGEYFKMVLITWGDFSDFGLWSSTCEEKGRKAANCD